jgi:XRE family aerobic/anaerobic benzoate catabolism transcriptional regulator
MAGNAEAMQDLRNILDGRAPFYSKAELRLDTSAQPLGETFERLRTIVRTALALGPPTSVGE